jgi:hypothetical protein
VDCLTSNLLARVPLTEACGSSLNLFPDTLKLVRGWLLGLFEESGILPKHGTQILGFYEDAWDRGARYSHVQNCGNVFW